MRDLKLSTALKLFGILFLTFSFWGIISAALICMGPFIAMGLGESHNGIPLDILLQVVFILLVPFGLSWLLFSWATKLVHNILKT